MTTEAGHIARMLQAADEAATPLTRKLTSQIFVIAGLSLAASVVLDLSRGQTFEIVLTSAIAFSIAATPSGLPAVVTTILAHGTRALAKAGAIVTRPRSTETLGATSALNCDKTGTFTLDQMTAVELALPGRRLTVSGSGYGTAGTIRHVAGDADLALEAFLLALALASDAVVDDGEQIGDPAEGALVVLAEKGGLDVQATRERYPRIAELPFDAAYKLMATFHRMPDERGTEVVRCFVKGAPDRLLGRAFRVLGRDLRPMHLDDAFRLRYLGENARLANQGLRVIATARRDFDPAEFDPEADLLPLLDGLTLLALVGIVDPPRTEAKAAVAEARAAGIQVRMVTGDHAVAAEAIAREVGIEGRAVTGAEFAAMSVERALAELDGIGVLARVTPEHKVQLVELLRRMGHVVAVAGDGVSDAPALKAADIGIAMGRTGNDVAKEAAAMLLTDDRLSTIVRAVEHGRELHESLVKYVRFQTGVLAGMILTFLGASVFNVIGGMAFLPLQTLYVTFTTQVPQAIGLGRGRPAEGLMARRPRAVEAPIVGRRDHLWLVLVALLHALATLSVIAIAEGTWDTDTARTMGLVTFALMNLLFSFTVRDELRSVFDLHTLADHTFLICSAISFAAIVVGTQTRLFERMLDTVRLDFGQWLLCLGAALTIVAASEARKGLLRRAA
jgi:Ca2+-transporting ATPase